MLSNFIKIFYALLCCNISLGTERGKTCDDGVCEWVKQCPTALQNIKKGIYPKICGFEGPNSDAIVCCPDLQQRIPAPSPDNKDENKNAEGIHFHDNKPKMTISKTKCREYAIKTCDGSLALTGDEGNRDYYPNKFPHMALIGYGEDSEIYWKCSGSLISESYILTAARCEFTDFGYAQWARLGISYHDKRDYEIIKRIIHPHYHHPHVHDDIALFKLSEKVLFDTYVHPICLYNDQEYFHQNHYFSVGIGKEKCIDSECHLQELDEFQTDTILATKSEIEENKKCINVFQNYEELEENTGNDFICAHLTDLQINKCQGMHGDTLLYKIETGCPSFYNLAGILSVVGHWPNEYECHFLNTTMIYTKIWHYLPWIEQIVWKYG